jgi:hypothetical protein
MTLAFPVHGKPRSREPHGGLAVDVPRRRDDRKVEGRPEGPAAFGLEAPREGHPRGDSHWEGPDAPVDGIAVRKILARSAWLGIGPQDACSGPPYVGDDVEEPVTAMHLHAWPYASAGVRTGSGSRGTNVAAESPQRKGGT